MRIVIVENETAKILFDSERQHAAFDLKKYDPYHRKSYDSRALSLRMSNDLAGNTYEMFLSWNDLICFRNFLNIMLKD